MAATRSTPSVLILERFEIDESDGELGAGDHGEVWRARDLQLGRTVALKFIPEAAGQGFALRHARALAAVPPHPNIVQVYDVHEGACQPGTDTLCGVIVMEHVAGRSLSQILGEGTVQPEVARQMSEGILDGLEHLHASAVAHGDLHDDNVLVVGGSAKLIDVAHDALSLSNITHARRQERDLDAAARFISDLLKLSGGNSKAYLEACPHRSIVEQRAALQGVRAVNAPQLSPQTDVHLEVSYKLDSTETTASGHCYRHNYLLSVRLLNESERTIKVWHLDVQVPAVLRPPATSYGHEVTERRTPRAFLLRRSSMSDGERVLFPGDSVEFTAPYMMDDGLNRQGGSVLSQEFVIRAFVEDVAIAHVRRTVEELTNF